MGTHAQEAQLRRSDPAKGPQGGPQEGSAGFGDDAGGGADGGADGGASSWRIPLAELTISDNAISDAGALCDFLARRSRGIV